MFKKNTWIECSDRCMIIEYCKKNSMMHACNEYPSFDNSLNIQENGKLMISKKRWLVLIFKKHMHHWYLDKYNIKYSKITYNIEYLNRYLMWYLNNGIIWL